MDIKKLPLLARVVIAIVLGIGLGMVAPDVVVRAFNTFNGIFDQLLKFLIPLIIVGLVTSAIADVGSQARKLLVITASMAYGATILSGLYSYVLSDLVFPRVISPDMFTSMEDAGRDLAPYFTITIPPLMDVMTSLVCAFLLGLGIAAFGAQTLKTASDEFKDIVTHTIEHVIIPLLPVYIFGLFLDMTAGGKVGPVLASFVQVIVIIFVMTVVLLLLQFCVAGLVVRRNPLKLLRGMLPAYFTALGTASSAATIPVTLKQTRENGVSDEVAGFVIPLSATIHLSGSTLKIVACAIAFMLMSGMHYDFPLMLGFIFLLGITMVAAPGVPGGAIMAALGILESILGFDAEQQAMIITLYIAMDSFGTACNVTGDGAIALIIDRLARKKEA